MATRLTGFVESLPSIDYGDGCGSGDGSGSGYGSGYGDGSGSGYGSGYGDGDGCGSGYGDGSGSGYGDGDGCGYGISVFCGHPVYDVDGLPTILTSVKSDIAKGYIIGEDLVLRPCYVARVGGFFAHGDTIESAMRDARAKHEECLPEQHRIDLFISRVSELRNPTGHDWFELHHTLTLSCKAGRSAFVGNKGISLDDPMSIDEFFSTVEGAYGWDTVARARQQWKTLNERKENN